MNARDRFAIGDRVRAANLPPRGRSRSGVVIDPWPAEPALVRVRRDSGRETVDGCLYWERDAVSS